MSSNIQVQKICQYCGNEFTARTITTMYCSPRCNKAGYKAIKRAEKVDATNKETQLIKSKPTQELKAKEYLTVTQVSKLLECSRQNVYKLINSGKLKATNLLIKKTIIKRTDLDKLLGEANKEPAPTLSVIPETQLLELYEWAKAGSFDIADCYTTEQVREKYGISESGLRNLIITNNIPKIRKGWYAYVPKEIIDSLFSTHHAKLS